MHPINNKNFGVKTGKLAVKFYDGSAVVTGYIVKQTGTNNFKVSKMNGTGQKICTLAQTATQLTALTAGTGADSALRPTLCTIEVTKYVTGSGDPVENVAKVSTYTMSTLQGNKITWSLGTAATAVGAGTVAKLANAPTVANLIPDQVATVAAAFSYIIPANTFADVNADVLTYTATLVGGAALTTVGFAFNATTRTVSKAAGASSIGTKSILITANDGALTIFDDFDVVVS